MAVSLRHVFSQGPVVAALARTAAAAALQKKNGHAPVPPQTPGPWFEAELPPRPDALIRDFVRWSGGDPAWIKGRVPPHLFPQWGFPLAARALLGLPYPLARVMNAGCRLDIRAPIPAGEPLRVRARLEAIDDDGRRALITQRIVTGTAAEPEALIADMKAYVPLAKREAGGGGRKPVATVPAGVKEIAFFKLGATAGRDFALLTGDVNPIHWVPAYARASGFARCILHGFATMARAVEAVNRRVLAGDAGRLATLDVRFTNPLLLPAQVGVYVGGGGELFVGDAPAGRSYLEGRFTLRKEPPRSGQDG